MGGSKVVVVVVVAWIIMVASVCRAQEKGDCMKQCVHDCYDNRAGMCAFNCALNCNWPFAQPTGEVLVSEEAKDNHASKESDEATKAAFEIHFDHPPRQQPRR